MSWEDNHKRFIEEHKGPQQMPRGLFEYLKFKAHAIRRNRKVAPLFDTQSDAQSQQHRFNKEQMEFHEMD